MLFKQRSLDLASMTILFKSKKPMKLFKTQVNLNQFLQAVPETAQENIRGGSTGIAKATDITLKRGTFGPDYFDGRLLTAQDLSADQSF